MTMAEADAVATGPRPSVGNAVLAAHPVATKARLLVVDDIEMNRDLLGRRLTGQGYHVEMAEGGAQALAMLQAAPFDLVLLDIMMPDMDGYEVLRRIRGDAVLQHLPVVMVSALGETESVVRCIELGADDYLTKPFNPLVLKARVTASLSRKWLRDREQLYAQSLTRELDIGRQIQAGFLPQACPQPKGFGIAAHFEPARSVGGDFYDVFTLHNGHVALIVADVCDKGVGAALYMALFRTLLRATALQESMVERSDAQLLGDVVAHTNEYIAVTHDHANMFATVFFGILDPRTGTLLYINGGHDAPIIASPEGPRVRLEPTGPALGLMGDSHFALGEDRLAPGELLLAYTDGVTDARRSSDGATFGEDRLRALLDCSEAAGLVLERVKASLVDFTGDGPPFDDVTMLAVRRGA
jgi:serine phosphatase RsbU (regulator of sigma subunit)